MEIARAWGSLPAKHLERVLNHLEKELVREHEYRMAVHQAQEERGKRLDRLYMAGLVAGFVLCAGMLVGGVLVGMHGPGWLAGVLCGPSLIAVGALFVLRRTNDSTIREVGRVAHGPLDVPPADGPPSS
ncbi:hypothetical protein [Kitasatospora sp. NPDC097691]|uniref:hypothetical protein n=1 Tax=Kitasatospora sp. NPDC097691 TaxID=3157231 RepID=UPI00331FC9EC